MEWKTTWNDPLTSYVACAGYLGHPFAKEAFSLVRISSPLTLRL